DRANEAQNAIPLAQAETKRVQAELEAAKRTSGESEKPIRVAAFSPDGVFLATGGDDRLVHTWSADTGQGVDTLRNHESAISALAFRACQEVVSASADGAVSGSDLSWDWTLD